MRSSPGGGTYVKIDGRGYSDKEVSRLGASGLNLTQSLAQLGDFGLYQFLMGLSSGARSENEAAEQFFVGRMILRDAAEKFGIHPADEEISSYIRSMRAFTNQDGAFDQTKYNTFIDKSLGRMGMTEGDVRDLASDVLISKKLNTLVGTGLAADRDIVTKTLALNNQQIDVNLAQIKLDPYEAKIEPTEDEIKAYWETIQDSFTTEPLRKFTYIIATPRLPEETAAEEAATKIKEALAAGKSFADAAKDAGIEETHSLEKITTSHQPNAEKEPAGLFQAASNTDPGSLAENIIESDRIFILHVAKREVVKEENATARIDSELNNTVSQNETIAFMAWMAARTEAAKVEYPGRK